MICAGCGSTVAIGAPRDLRGAVVAYNHNLGEARAQLRQEGDVPSKADSGASHFILGDLDYFADVNLILGMPAWCSRCRRACPIDGSDLAQLRVKIEEVRIHGRDAKKPVRVAPL